MFPQLNEILEVNVNSLDRENLVYVNEKGSGDGTFILHHYISLFIKNGQKVCLVSLNQSLAHFNNVGNKLGLNLISEKEKNNFHVIEGLKLIGKQIVDSVSHEGPKIIDGLIDFSDKDIVRKNSSSLKSFYMQIKTMLHLFDLNDHVVLILEDILILCHLGIPVLDILCFIKYLQNLTHDQSFCKVTLVIFAHEEGNSDPELNVVTKYLQHNSQITLTTESLQSGTCKAVDGQLTVTWQDLSSGILNKQKTMHYKIKDKTVDFYPLGMSSAVL